MVHIFTVCMRHNYWRTCFPSLIPAVMLPISTICVIFILDLYDNCDITRNSVFVYQIDSLMTLDLHDQLFEFMLERLNPKPFDQELRGFDG